MKNKLETLNMWLRRAEKVDSIDISQENIIEARFDDFKQKIGGIYEYDGYLYSKSQKNPSKWLKFRFPSIVEGDNEEIEKLKLICEKLTNLISKLKLYIDREILDIKERQEEFFLELKDYIDNKIQE